MGVVTKSQGLGGSSQAGLLLPSPCTERERGAATQLEEKKANHQSAQAVWVIPVCSSTPLSPGGLGKGCLAVKTRCRQAGSTAPAPAQQTCGDSDGKQLRLCTCSSSRHQLAALPAPRAPWFALLGGRGSNAVQVDEQRELCTGCQQHSPDAAGGEGKFGCWVLCLPHPQT